MQPMHPAPCSAWPAPQNYAEDEAKEATWTPGGQGGSDGATLGVRNPHLMPESTRNDA